MERNWFKSIVRGVRKVATPANIGKVASLVLRDGESLLTERDLEALTDRDIEELIQRNWFKSIVRGVKKIATPANLGKAAKIASFVIREDAEELSQRDLEYLEDLSTREPSVGSFFRKVKNFFKPSNIDKAAETAKTISNLVREDVGDLAERDLDFEFSARELEDLEDLAVRDATFGAIFRNIVSREGVIERDFADYEMEDLD